VSEFAPQVDAGHYRTDAYNTKERLCSMWHQLDEVRSFGPSTVLEVGPGNGMVTGWLRDRGIAVTTVDIDATCGPDDLASVTALPYDDAAFDVALCCEVLEHLPFDAVPRALRELRRVARTGVVISVPDERPWTGVAYPLYFGLHVDALRLRYPIPRRALLAALRGRIRWRDAAFIALVPERWSRGGKVAAPRRPPIPHIPPRLEFDGEHHWEIGTAGHPVERLERAYADAGLLVLRDFRVPEMPWHHFWSLAPAVA
jgi:SAM-dependent methyltransferase